jgi:hypothetical protein
MAVASRYAGCVDLRVENRRRKRKGMSVGVLLRLPCCLETARFRGRNPKVVSKQRCGCVKVKNSVVVALLAVGVAGLLEHSICGRMLTVCLMTLSTLPVGPGGIKAPFASSAAHDMIVLLCGGVVVVVVVWTERYHGAVS